MSSSAQHSGAPPSGKAKVRARVKSNGSTTDETELVRGVAANERWAAEALYERVYPSIAASLQRVLHHPGHDYDDLVQTTFERLIRSLLEQGGERILNLAAWASGIATHAALDALRARVRERGLFQAEDTSGTVQLGLAGSVKPERQLEARQKLVVVQEVLANMKADLAEAVVLHDVVGHDLAETAALTNVTKAAAQSRLVRGRKELLRRVEQRLAREKP